MDEKQALIRAIKEKTPEPEEYIEEFVEYLSELGMHTASEFNQSLINITKNSLWWAPSEFEIETRWEFEEKFEVTDNNFGGKTYWFAKNKDAALQCLKMQVAIESLEDQNRLKNMCISLLTLKHY